MKRRTLVAMALVSPMLLSCASLVGPREVDIPLTTLQEAVEKKFPYSNSVLALLDIDLSRPALSLLPDKNRVQISMDTLIAPVLLNRSWTGNFTVSGNLALNPANASVVLASPRVEHLVLDGADPTIVAQARKVGNVFIGEILSDVPLYKFDPKKLTFAGVRMRPTAIETKADRLVVTFEPVR